MPKITVGQARQVPLRWLLPRQRHAVALWKWNHCPFGGEFQLSNGRRCYGPHMVGLLVGVVQRVVAGFPGRAQAGRGQVPVRADLAGHLAQIAAQVLEQRPARTSSRCRRCR